ncbi:MAG TPA: winged helix-turn-helix domain-containing protein, partial [Xanthomonadales bacterium]|nr:winged helix-turn-helix domain-containing protein [Xanthomonadales bacterium]
MAAIDSEAGAAGRLLIGEWTFDPRSLELARGDARERLPRRLGLLLERLAREPGAVVARETLLRDVWGRVHVDEDLLSRNVAALRRALGDDPREPRYVETIPKAGYRLVASVAIAAPAPASIAARAAHRPRWIAGGIALAVAIAALVAGWLALRAPRAPAVDATAFDRAQPLTSEPGWELGPSLSRDGQLVAYAEASPDRRGGRLVVRSVDGTAGRVLDEPDGVLLGPVLLPDGSAVAFRRLERGSCEVRVRQLFARSRKVATCAPGVASSLDVSPDGARIVYTAPPAAADRAAGLA